MKIIINGTEYDVAATLRVAYKLQGYNNHKPYMEIIRGIGDMPVEKQIEIMYAAFEVANPEATQIYTLQKFREYYLDHVTAKELLDQVQAVLSELLGVDIADAQPAQQASADADADAEMAVAPPRDLAPVI